MFTYWLSLSNFEINLWDMLQDLKSSCMHKRLLFRDIEKVGFFDVSICYPKLYYGKGTGNPLQYSCLENPVDRGTWWAAVHGVAQSQTRLKRLSLHACMHWRRKWQPIPVFLPGESQGQRSMVSCHLWGRTELDTTDAT